MPFLTVSAAERGGVEKRTVLGGVKRGRLLRRETERERERAGERERERERERGRERECGCGVCSGVCVRVPVPPWTL